MLNAVPVQDPQPVLFCKNIHGKQPFCIRCCRNDRLCAEYGGDPESRGIGAADVSREDRYDKASGFVDDQHGGIRQFILHTGRDAADCDACGANEDQRVSLQETGRRPGSCRYTDISAAYSGSCFRIGKYLLYAGCRAQALLRERDDTDHLTAPAVPRLSAAGRLCPCLSGIRW